MYIAPRQWGQKNLWQQKGLFSLQICFKMISSKYFIHIFNDFIHVYSPGGKGRKLLGDKLLMSTENPYHFDHLLQVSNKSLLILILYTFLMVFHMYIAQGQGQTTICGQNSDVNKKGSSLCPFVASLKKIYLWSLILYIFLPVFIHVYSPGAGADNPLGSEFLF